MDGYKYVTVQGFKVQRFRVQRFRGSRFRGSEFWVQRFRVLRMKKANTRLPGIVRWVGVNLEL
jgi:hypothetical protein